MAQEGTSNALTYTWKLKDFTKLTSEDLYSDVFVLGGYKWQLVAYLMEIRDDEHLSLFLKVADSSVFPEGWSIDMKYLTFTVVNQFHSRDSIEWSTVHRFHAQEPYCCFYQIEHLEVVENPTNGFLVDDLLLVTVCFSESEESLSSWVVLKSKNLLRELSSMNRPRRSISRSKTSGSILPLNPRSLQDLMNALQSNLSLSLESIVEANAFDDIERISVILGVLEDLAFRLPTIKGTLVGIKRLADVRARLDQGRVQLCSLKANYSEVREEEMKIKDEISRLTAQGDELHDRKISLSFELRKMNEELSKDLEEWRDISKGIVEEDEKFIQTRKKLEQASLR